jgi:hypothetical protein
MIKELRATLMKTQHIAAVNGNTSTSHPIKARLQSATNYGIKKGSSSIYTGDKGT